MVSWEAAFKPVPFPVSARGAGGKGIEAVLKRRFACLVLPACLSEHFKRPRRGDYYVDHGNAVYPQSAAGSPFTAAYIQSKGDPIADLVENLAAEGATL